MIFDRLWPSWDPLKNGSRDHAKYKFYSLAKPILLCTTGKRILYSSIFAIEPIADISPLLGCWPAKNGLRDHDQKQSPRGVPRKRCSENMQQFTGEHPCRSAISIKLQSHIDSIKNMTRQKWGSSYTKFNITCSE